MRSLKCKVLKLCEHIKPKEPGKAIYRRKRWQKFDREMKEYFVKNLKKQKRDIKGLRRTFYYASKKEKNDGFDKFLTPRGFTQSLLETEPQEEARSRSYRKLKGNEVIPEEDTVVTGQDQEDSKINSGLVLNEASSPMNSENSITEGKLRQQIIKHRRLLNRKERFVGLSQTREDLKKKVNRIADLAKHLNQDEIDLISDDPLFFFSVNGEVIDDQFINQNEWDFQSKLRKNRGKPSNFKIVKENKKRTWSFCRPENVQFRQVEHLISRINRVKSQTDIPIYHKMWRKPKLGPNPDQILAFVHEKQQNYTQKSRALSQKNSRRLQKSRSLKKRVESRRLQNLKITEDNFEKKMNQGLAISRAVKTSHQLRRQEGIEKDRLKKIKIARNQRKIQLENELKALNETIKNESLKAYGNFKKQNRGSKQWKNGFKERQSFGYLDNKMIKKSDPLSKIKNCNSHALTNCKMASR